MIGIVWFYNFFLCIKKNCVLTWIDTPVVSTSAHSSSTCKPSLILFGEGSGVESEGSTSMGPSINDDIDAPDAPSSSGGSSIDSEELLAFELGPLLSPVLLGPSSLKWFL